MEKARGGPAGWLLSASERGNDAGWLYRGRIDGMAWSEGNQVRALVDGATYFARLCQALRGVGQGDHVYFVDWRGDPEQRLDGPGTAVLVELARARSAEAHVHGLVWRSHLDRLRFSSEENRNLAQALQAMNAPVDLDMRVRRGGSHHQKFVIIRHPGSPERDVAFVGGTDLGHSRNDGPDHRGDRQAQPMAVAYGATPPWHDAMVEIRGPAVADVECCFRERWEDPTSLQHARPLLWATDKLRDLRGRTRRLPDPLPPPDPCGGETVQLLRTYPCQRPAYPFAPNGERTVARGYAKALGRAEHLVYVEDQYLWSRTVALVFAEALRRSPALHLVAVLPRFPDSDGVPGSAAVAAQTEAVEVLRAAGGDRVHLYDIENEDGTPIYVHAKICIVDDIWAAVGSANLNRRSWTHDSELTAAVITDPGQDTFARRLRLRLWTEHLARPAGDDADLRDLCSSHQVLAEQAHRLEHWHRQGQAGPRPTGRLRPHRLPQLAPRQRTILRPFIRLVADPDGRCLPMRRHAKW